MERKPDTRMDTKTEDADRKDKICNEMIWTLLHSYTRRLAYLPSDQFRNKAEDLRNKIMKAIEQSEGQPEPESESQLKARIVAICNQDGIPIDHFPEELSESGEQADEKVKASAATTVKAEATSGSKKKSAKKRKSKQKSVEPKPVVFLEDDAEDDFGYDYYRSY